MKSKVLLILIVIFAAYLRLSNITQLPLFFDEVDAGYQAYIYNQNGTDFYGNKNPMSFHSFSDWRTPFFIYPIAIVQKITNSPELSIRLPSVIFGLAVIPILFLLTGSLIPPILWAISPWSIHYNRTGFEVSGMLFCLITGIYLWHKFTQSKKLLPLSMSLISFISTAYFYSTAKLFLLLLIPVFVFLYRQIIFKTRPRTLIIAFLITLVFSFPLIKDTLNGEGGYRFSYINIFSPNITQSIDRGRYDDSLLTSNTQIGVAPNLESKIIHNKVLPIWNKFTHNYLASFSLDFLTLAGDTNARHGFGGGHGLVYSIEFISIILGLFITFKSKPVSKLSLLFFCLLFLSPIPYSLTGDSDSPHATRLILMLPSLIYFSYIGIQSILSKKKIAILFFLILSFSFFSFWHYYRFHYPQDNARAWGAGIREAIIASKDSYSTHYIFSNYSQEFFPYFLYYKPYQLPKNDSILTHLQAVKNNGFEGKSIDNRYYFGKINWEYYTDFPNDSVFITTINEWKSIPKLFTTRTIKILPTTFVNQDQYIIFTKN